ncbi:H-2 class II histocompatibility antigen, A-U alpha chain-like [Chanos chanos]|uniref:H-2 class II histocompatibility antigen, A-U alpha chain-like n=1 Tax=Chanos chanos TaxID=29144 RepID=A0A6J2UN46_CHACN|nr:H-2 class II histocompatibility antigen, A-U alpha chain-like [Chanos chanos]
MELEIHEKEMCLCSSENQKNFVGALDDCDFSYLHAFDTDEICSDTADADELTFQYDEDEIGYIDFKSKESVLTLPAFADPIPFSYYFDVIAEIADCHNRLQLAKDNYVNPPKQSDPPKIVIYFKDNLKPGKENTLICYMTGFYPPAVKVTWTKNNVNVTEGMTLGRYTINDDGTFAVFSFLRITPEEGAIYACTVEHQALFQPQTRELDVEITEQLVDSSSLFCGLAVILGLLGMAVGAFFFNK